MNRTEKIRVFDKKIFFIQFIIFLVGVKNPHETKVPWQEKNSKLT